MGLKSLQMGRTTAKRMQCNVCVRKDSPSLSTGPWPGVGVKTPISSAEQKGSPHLPSPASQHQASISGEGPYLILAPKNSSSASGHFHSCKLLNTHGSVLEIHLPGPFPQDCRSVERCSFKPLCRR